MSSDDLSFESWCRRHNFPSTGRDRELLLAVWSAGHAKRPKKSLSERVREWLVSAKNGKGK